MIYFHSFEDDNETEVFVLNWKLNSALIISLEVRYLNVDVIGPKANLRSDEMLPFCDLYFCSTYQVDINEASRDEFNIDYKSSMIPVHSAIICEKSEYFRTMMISGIKESRTKLIELPEQLVVLQVIIKHLYEQAVFYGLSNELAANVFVAANKYLLSDLAGKMVAFLCKHCSCLPEIIIAIKIIHPIRKNAGRLWDELLLKLEKVVPNMKEDAIKDLMHPEYSDVIVKLLKMRQQSK